MHPSVFFIILRILFIFNPVALAGKKLYAMEDKTAERLGSGMTNQLFSFSNNFADGQLLLPFGEVRQVAELSILRSTSIDTHIQRCDEITYAISGTATFFSGEESATLSPGQVHYIRKGIPHTITADPGGNFRYLCIGFIPDESYPPIADLLPRLHRFPYFITGDDSRIKTLSELLINEFYDWDLNSPTMVNAYLVQLVTTLLRLVEGKKLDVSRQKLQRTASQFAIYHILRYIDREYRNITCIRDVAKHTSYSEYYISHLFSDKMGMTIKEYITRKKVLHGAELLLDTSISVAEAAEASGFASAHSFSLAFRRHMGCSPTEHRKKA